MEIKKTVSFRPHQRPDGFYAIMIDVENTCCGFVHWIESINGKICTVSRADMVMSPIFSIEECQANCNWLNEAYERGEVK